MSVHRFVCVDCGQEKIHVDSFTTGYGIDKQGTARFATPVAGSAIRPICRQPAARFST